MLIFLKLIFLKNIIRKKKLKYKMVAFHTSRPGHDLRYALDGGLMKELGWEPKVSIEDRINEVVQWTLNNDRMVKVWN